MPEDSDQPAATHYIHVSGSTLKPLWSSGTTNYDGAGCVHMGGSSAFLNASVELPYNSAVTQLRMYWKDTSASDGTLWFAQYDDGLDYTYVVTMTTTGSSGWGTTTVNFAKILDYVNFSYSVL